MKAFIDSDIPQPATTDAQFLDAWKKNVAKVRRILLEGFRDHIVSKIQEKETPYAMCKALKNLFQNSNDHRKTTLKENLRNIKMEKGDTIQKYLKISLNLR